MAQHRASFGGIEERFDYLLCPRLVRELTDVLVRPKIAGRLTDADRDRFLGDVLGAAREVDDPTAVYPPSRDRDDDYLFALAVEHAAARIVTGDNDLLAVNAPPAPVMRLRAFLEQLDTEES